MIWCPKKGIEKTNERPEGADLPQPLEKLYYNN